MTMSITSPSSFSETIHLKTVHRDDDGRNVAYSTVGPDEAPCVLFFYPGGGNRRMVVSLHEKMPHLKLICVNRPGKGETSPSVKGEAHLTTAVQDAAFVLDTLGVEHVSLLCMCAGTPFAMAFAVEKPERTTGQFIGISSWVLPSDCGYDNTKVTFYLGTRAPFVSPIVGSIMSSIGMSLTSVPTTWAVGALRSKLSPKEQEAFDIKYQDKTKFIEQMMWMQEERGGEGEDISVLLGRAGLIDYRKLGETHNVVLWHGTKDKMVPYSGAEWLVDHVPGANLNTIQDGTHEGANFLLHSSIVDSLKTLA